MVRSLLVTILKKSILALVLLGLISPLLFLFVQSIAYGWRWPALLPPALSVRAWEVLANDPYLQQAVVMTILIGGMVVLMNLLIAWPAGKAIAHFSFKGKSSIETWLLMPILIPSLAIAMGIHLTMIRLDLVDTWWGVVLVHLIPTVPYSIRIMRSGYERLGQKWAEQATSLGVSGWRIFWTISVPLLLPSIRSCMALAFVISLSQYVLTALIGGGHVLTLALIYYPYWHSTDTAVLAAFSLLFALLPVMFLLFLEGLLRLILFKGRVL